MDKTIRKVTDFQEQQNETYRYWQGRPGHERLEAVAEIVRAVYSLKGIDLDAQRPRRTLVRVEQTRR